MIYYLMSDNTQNNIQNVVPNIDIPQVTEEKIDEEIKKITITSKVNTIVLHMKNNIIHGEILIIKNNEVTTKMLFDNGIIHGNCVFDDKKITFKNGKQS